MAQNKLHPFFPALTFLLLSICSHFPFPVFSDTAIWTPRDDYLIDCGATQNSTFNGKNWQSDANSSYVSGSEEEIFASAKTTMNSGLPTFGAQVYATARIFNTPAAYTFPVQPGTHWLRLYFYPFAFRNFDPHSAIFTVIADGFTLLSNMNLVAVLKNLNVSYLCKEYSLQVQSNNLVIKFVPAGENGSFAFINGLEVVSMPVDAIPWNGTNGTNNGAPEGGKGKAVETTLRLNVGGQAINPSNDSGLTRSWDEDESYLSNGPMMTATIQSPPSSIKYPSDVPQYIAPRTVYSTARELADSSTAEQSLNISWLFPIDLNFTHYIRLHLCELMYDQKFQRVFNVYVQNQTASASLDLIGNLGLKQNESKYLDYVADPIPGVNTLSVKVGSVQNSGSQFHNVILNGIEIFKASDSTGNLAALSVGSKITKHSSSASTHSKRLVWYSIGAVVLGAIAVVAFSIGCWRFCYIKHETKVFPPPSPLNRTGHVKFNVDHNSNIENSNASVSLQSISISYQSSAANQPCRLFSFQEITAATNNFDEALVIGEGGFGKVYKGEINGTIPVAIKRANTRSDQGLREFQNEIELLSILRHRHLVTLIGFCEENGEMILVYEYMANGTLRHHLYGSDKCLSWRQRLEICIGAARGLHYLHTGINQGIIHRDVKSTNILLDSRFVAKVADFGLSKTGPPLDKTHVSTRVKGSFGYLDPEYFRTQQLTEKSDVYSFGVVLLEVVCARPVINPCPSKKAMNIVEWALQWQERGLPEKIVDSKLTGTFNPESLDKVLQIARRCLKEKGSNRPTMGDVLWHLEYALQLQNGGSLSRVCSTMPEGGNGSNEGIVHSLMSLQEVGNEVEEIRHREEEDTDGDEDGQSSSDHGIENMEGEQVEEKAAICVFSQFFNCDGR